MWPVGSNFDLQNEKNLFSLENKASLTSKKNKFGKAEEADMINYGWTTF